MMNDKSILGNRKCEAVTGPWSFPVDILIRRTCETNFQHPVTQLLCFALIY